MPSISTTKTHLTVRERPPVHPLTVVGCALHELQQPLQLVRRPIVTVVKRGVKEIGGIRLLEHLTNQILCRLQRSNMNQGPSLSETDRYIRLSSNTNRRLSNQDLGNSGSASHAHRGMMLDCRTGLITRSYPYLLILQDPMRRRQCGSCHRIPPGVEDVLRQITWEAERLLTH